MSKVNKAKQIINTERQKNLKDVIDRVNAIMAQKYAFMEECDRKVQEILGDEYIITNVVAYKEI
jgi:F0F1-type ATP synthase membrane subunit b/b'